MFYYFARVIIVPVLFVLMFCPKIVGRKNMPKKGKVIYICNHKTLLDPVIFGYFSRRQIIFLAKKELFKNKFATFIMEHYGAISVDRGSGATGAIKKAFKVLKKEQPLGIFPEGRRVKEMDLGHFEPGAAMIALKTDTPVVPVAIKGQVKFFHRLKVVIGEPMNLKDYVGSEVNTDSIAEATELLHNKILELRQKVI